MIACSLITQRLKISFFQTMLDLFLFDSFCSVFSQRVFLFFKLIFLGVRTVGTGNADESIHNTRANH